MAESAEHRQLVDDIVCYVSERFGYAHAMIILCDRPGTSSERPPRIGGFVPDVYAADVPTTFSVLGEAKTEEDLETTRTGHQISAFLQFLASSQDSVFILAVPWRASVTARELLRSKINIFGADNVEIVLLDGIKRPTPMKTRTRC